MHLNIFRFDRIGLSVLGQLAWSVNYMIDKIVCNLKQHLKPRNVIFTSTERNAKVQKVNLIKWRLVLSYQMNKPPRRLRPAAPGDRHLSRAHRGAAYQARDHLLVTSLTGLHLAVAVVNTISHTILCYLKISCNISVRVLPNQFTCKVRCAAYTQTPHTVIVALSKN